MKLKLTTLFLVICGALLGQNETAKAIEGRILSKGTKEAIPYANVFNKALQKGTISNNDGYFRIEAVGLNDPIFITFIGYKEQVIALKEGLGFYTVVLEESAQLLSEVVVTPKNNSYLFDLIANCKRKPSDVKKTAKAYYELKSYRDDAQVELVESFYNVDILGYELMDMKLKAGRLALQPYDDRFFASLESSMAIAMLKLMDKNLRYPNSPLDLSKKALRKNYYLYLDKKYLDNDADSIYVVDFEPNKRSGLFYEGKLWINKTKLLDIFHTTPQRHNGLGYKVLKINSLCRCVVVSLCEIKMSSSVKQDPKQCAKNKPKLRKLPKTPIPAHVFDGQYLPCRF